MKTVEKEMNGEHYCKDHQGNGSHYGKKNCTVCRLEEELSKRREEPRVLQVGDMWYVKIPDRSLNVVFLREITEVTKETVTLADAAIHPDQFRWGTIYKISDVEWVEKSNQKKFQEIPFEYP